MNPTREMKLSMSIVSEVEKVCKERNISRAELSGMLYVSPPYITMLFNGIRP
jgi:hypothetical protein